MSSGVLDPSSLGPNEAEAAALGEDSVARVRTFRLVILLAQELRTLMDELLREDGLTTQQAALLTAIGPLGRPSLTQAAAALGTTHQNVRQLVTSLERKGFLRLVRDEADGRVRRLVATEASDTVWRRRSAGDQQRVLEWFSVLTESEARTLFQLLLRLEASVRGSLHAR
jgi:DNA-binding MarR family transcriptional regulator